MRAILSASLVLAATLASSFAVAHPSLGGGERIARPTPERVARPAADRVQAERVQRVRDTDRVVRHSPPPGGHASIRAEIKPQVACQPGDAGCGSGQARGEGARAAASHEKKLDPAMVKAARAYLDHVKNMKCGARGRCE